MITGKAAKESVVSLPLTLKVSPAGVEILSEEFRPVAVFPTRARSAVRTRGTQNKTSGGPAAQIQIQLGDFVLFVSHARRANGRTEVSFNESTGKAIERGSLVLDDGTHIVEITLNDGGSLQRAAEFSRSNGDRSISDLEKHLVESIEEGWEAYSRAERDLERLPAAIEAFSKQWLSHPSVKKTAVGRSDAAGKQCPKGLQERLWESKTDRKVILCHPQSPLKEAWKPIQQESRNPNIVVFVGASGTGKGLLARAFHDMSERATKPFVVANIAGLPETLVESELFGCVPGAFTGAVFRIGVFERGDKGTVFVDEIAEIPLPVQVKLLRFFQERTFSKLGSCTEQHVDVRVVAATNKDLKAEVEAGRFRKDLYFRLGAEVQIPSLAERRIDILPLLAQFSQSSSGSAPVRRTVHYSSELFKLLLWYSWPGNVRELQNFCERTLETCPQESVTVDDLPYLRLQKITMEGLLSALDDYRKTASHLAQHSTCTREITQVAQSMFQRSRMVLEILKAVPQRQKPGLKPPQVDRKNPKRELPTECKMEIHKALRKAERYLTVPTAGSGLVSAAPADNACTATDAAPHPLIRQLTDHYEKQIKQKSNGGEDSTETILAEAVTRAQNTLASVFKALQKDTKTPLHSDLEKELAGYGYAIFKEFFGWDYYKVRNQVRKQEKPAQAGRQVSPSVSARAVGKQVRHATQSLHRFAEH